MNKSEVISKSICFPNKQHRYRLFLMCSVDHLHLRAWDSARCDLLFIIRRNDSAATAGKRAASVRDIHDAAIPEIYVFHSPPYLSRAQLKWDDTEQRAKCISGSTFKHSGDGDITASHTCLLVTQSLYEPLTSIAPKWDFVFCDNKASGDGGEMVASALQLTVAKTLTYKYLTKNYMK